jgi:hypothetical protein
MSLTPRTTLYRLPLAQQIKHVYDCCLKDPDWLSEEVAEILAYSDKAIAYGPMDGYEGQDEQADILAVVVLGNGDYGLFGSREGQAGHHSRCTSMALRGPSLSELLDHLTNTEVARLLSRANHE